MNTFTSKALEIANNAYDTITGAPPEKKESLDDLKPGAIERDLAALASSSERALLGAEVVTDASQKGEKPSETSLIDTLTDPTTLTIGAAAAAGIASMSAADSKTSAEMRNIGLGLAAAAAPSFLPEKYKGIGKMIGYATSAYLLGGKALKIAGHVIAHPIDSITKIFSDPKEFLRDVGLATPEDAEKTEEQMKEQHEKEKVAATPEAKEAKEARGDERTRLTEKLSFHAEGSPGERRQLAEATVGTLSPETISLMLARYDRLLAKGEFKVGAPLEEVTEAIYEQMKETEMAAIEEKMYFWEKGPVKVVRIVASAGLSAIPFVGNIYSAGIAIAGYDPMAGESLSKTGRIIAGATALIPFGGVIRGGIRLGANLGRSVAKKVGSVARWAGVKMALNTAPHLVSNPSIQVAVSSAQAALQSALRRGNQAAITTARAQLQSAKSALAHPTGQMVLQTGRGIGKAIGKYKKTRELVRAFAGRDEMDERLKSVTALNELGTLLGKTEADDGDLSAVNDNFARDAEEWVLSSVNLPSSPR